LQTCIRITPGHIKATNSWCPFCTNSKLCGNINCEYCINKTILSHPIIKLWSNKNKIKPIYVFKSSKKKYKFNCQKCDNIFISSLHNIIDLNHWCDCTKNKTESKFYKFLISNNNFNVCQQKKFNWCTDDKTGRKLHFDFIIKDFKIIIELDGEQHFKQVANWNSPIKTQQRDIYKMKCANKNGYTVIRILQKDVWNDKNDWQKNLIKSIEKYSKPNNIFINITLSELIDKAKTSEYIKLFC